MNSLVVDDLKSPWETDATGLWSLSSEAASRLPGTEGLGMTVVAQSGPEISPAPWAQRRFAPPLDLSKHQELRLWLRSSHAGDGISTPFYLSFEATRDPPVAADSWKRLLPVAARETWELHRLWLGDMPAGLRQAVGFLRLRSLAPRIAFRASMDSLIAGTPEALADVDAAWLERLHGRFQVEGGPTAVSAVLDLPEKPGDRSLPHILITPWSVEPADSDRPGGEVIDNFTPAGAFSRPQPRTLQLVYRLDVFAEKRGDKARLLEQILRSFAVRPYLMALGERLGVTLLAPPEPGPPGRTPQFYRLAAQLEVGERQFRPQAAPFLVTAPEDGRETAEAVAP